VDNRVPGFDLLAKPAKIEIDRRMCVRGTDRKINYDACY